MKTLLLLLAFAISATSQPYIIGIGTNTVYPSNTWWTLKPSTNRLDNWEAWYTQNTNWAWAASILSETNKHGAALSASKGHWLLSTNQPFALSGISDANATNINRTELWIQNTAGSNITVTIPTPWKTPDGARSYTVTNGDFVGVLRVVAYGATTTNAEFKPFW